MIESSTDIMKFKNFNETKTEITSGIVFIYRNKILLLHPSNEKWSKSFSYPKGHVDEGETIEEAAVRETKEEIGVNVNPKHLNHKYRLITKNDKGNIRIDYYYLLYLNTKLFEKFFKKNTHIKKSKLQKKEIDWAGFMNKTQAENKIKPRLKRVLTHI